MTKLSITIDHEIDLADYEDEIKEFYNDYLRDDEENCLLEDLKSYVEELQKDLFFRHTPNKRTVENIFNDLEYLVRKYEVQ